MDMSFIFRYIEFLWLQDDCEFPALMPDVGDGFTEQEVLAIETSLQVLEDQQKVYRAAEYEAARIARQKYVPGFDLQIIKEGGWFRLSLHCGTTIPYTITPPVLSIASTGRYPRHSNAVSVWGEGFRCETAAL